jgi:hypothetical protein
MYQAELRGKLSKRNEDREDILTSNVFSFFQYADRRVFLYRLINSWGFKITKEDALQAEFRFWPQFTDGTEPDLVILVGDYYLLIEAKYLSGFGQETATIKHQLVREAEGGRYEARNLGKEFGLLAVTADHYLRREVQEQVPEEIGPSFKWTNWQHIALTIFKALESRARLAAETRAFAEDLYALLLQKNLRSYAGAGVLGDSLTLTEHQGTVFFEATTASYRGSFLGFLASLEFETQLVPFMQRIFFGQSQSLFAPLRDSVGTLTQHEAAIFFQGLRSRRLFGTLGRIDGSITEYKRSIFITRER